MPETPNSPETAHLIVVPDATVPHRGTLIVGAQRYPCAIGKAGVTAEKREGDHKSPIGRYPLRRVFYRPDVFKTPPSTALPIQAIGPNDGWCDDPALPDYNRPVALPFAGSHEKLWRDDRVYDLVIEIGYNDDPPVPGRGSAIFLHIARPDFSGTEGCVALPLDDVLEIIRDLDSNSTIAILAS